VISAHVRPRLAARARLRLDKITGRQMLLGPERGLELNPTGSAIATLCTGERTVADIVATLASTYGQDAAALAPEVQGFIQQLVDRGWVETLP
jgi:coenzyme PQQ biosynthesis protein PqqD